MEKAQIGLAGVESVAEKADQVRRHPLATTALVLALGLGATLTLMGIRNSDTAKRHQIARRGAIGVRVPTAPARL